MDGTFSVYFSVYNSFFYLKNKLSTNAFLMGESTCVHVFQFRLCSVLFKYSPEEDLPDSECIHSMVEFDFVKKS